MTREEKRLEENYETAPVPFSVRKMDLSFFWYRLHNQVRTVPLGQQRLDWFVRGSQ